MLKRTVLIMAMVLVMALSAGVVVVQAGNLEPADPPGPTMKTLDEIPPTWSQTLPASERFVLVLGGAGVLDKETGLVWEQSPENATYTWISALTECYRFEVGGRKGWRLPTIEQLASLVDSTQSNPPLPSGHPFSNVQSSFYWSATTGALDTTRAWGVGFHDGYVYNGVDKSGTNYVWCVRGGQGYDAY